MAQANVEPSGVAKMSNDELLRNIKVGDTGAPVVNVEKASPDIMEKINFPREASIGIEFKKGSMPPNLKETAPRTPEGLPVVVDGKTLEQIVEHFKGDLRVERGGVLVGNFIEDEKGQRYAVTDAFLEAKHGRGTGGSFTFTADTWSTAIKEVEGKYPDKVIVGWVHSHPQFTPAPSGYDSFIMEHFFDQPEMVTLIVNQNTMEVGNFRLLNGQSANVGGILMNTDTLSHDLNLGTTKDTFVDEKRGTQRVVVNTTRDAVTGEVIKIEISMGLFEKWGAELGRLLDTAMGTLGELGYDPQIIPDSTLDELLRLTEEDIEKAEILSQPTLVVKPEDVGKPEPKAKPIKIDKLSLITDDLKKKFGQLLGKI